MLAFNFCKRRGEPICQGIRHSGPLPCSSAFSGNTACLAGVQWTWSGQHQVHHGLLTKHQYTRSNRKQPKSQKLYPLNLFPLVGFWLSVAWLQVMGMTCCKTNHVLYKG
ncbi:hypothetical protein R3I94_008241 [Phoxinus phoxinus]